MNESIEQPESAELQESQRIESLWEETSEASDVEIVGRPEQMAFYHHEQPDGTSCAPTAASSALEAAGIEDYDIERTLETGTREGWYVPESADVPEAYKGTPEHYMGRPWTNAGVDIEHSYHELDPNDPELASKQADIFMDLESDVAQGKAVLVAVETSPLPQWDGQRGGHALWVTGTEHSANGSYIICNDSGLPGNEGRAVRYDAEAFNEAWQSSDYFRVTSKESILFK